MRVLLSRVIIAASLLGVTVLPGWAHHSFTAEFDVNQPVTLRGTVTKMEWINPHAWIHVDVKKPDGTVEQWMIEGGTPNTLIRRGFTKGSVKPGTEIVVEGFRARDGTNKANGRDLTLPDGRKLLVGATGAGAPPGTRDPADR